LPPRAFADRDSRRRVLAALVWRSYLQRRRPHRSAVDGKSGWAFCSNGHANFVTNPTVALLVERSATTSSQWRN
jgi:hypothetical protein